MTEQDSLREYEERKAYWLFTAIGIGYLFPFSALTQPVDYWTILFPDFNVEFSITVVYMWVNLIMLTGLVFFGGDPIYKNRIYGGFTGQLIVLIIVPSSWFLNLGEYYNYVVVMTCTLVAAIVTAFIDSCAISFSAQYPANIQAGLQLGIGLSTLIGSVYRIFTKLVFPADMVVSSSLLYFYCGAMTIGVCIYSYHELRGLELSKKCVIYGRSADSFIENICCDDKHSTAEMSPLMFSTSPPHRTKYGSSNGSVTSEGDYESFGEVLGAASGLPRRDSGSQEDKPTDFAGKMRVLRKVFPNLLVVFLLFVSTLVLWPAVITEIPSYNSPYLEETRWWSLILLFLFAVSDCLGRFFVDHKFGITASNVWVFALVRCLICCPLIVCSAKGIFFTNDLWSMIFIIALGYSNGYLGSLSIILVNDCVEESEMGLAGTFTGVFLNGGLVVGATLSLVADKIINSY